MGMGRAKSKSLSLGSSESITKISNKYGKMSKTYHILRKYCFSFYNMNKQIEISLVRKER
jgi:hypothetical protein